jgi:hypothetical protein
MIPGNPRTAGDRARQPQPRRPAPEQLHVTDWGIAILLSLLLLALLILAALHLVARFV